jgi:5'-methylthioadenosine phosphorylase
MSEAKIGVFGGSGLYNMEGLSDIETVEMNTPFGKPSDRFIIGTLEGKRVAFLPRHGRGHRISPSELNFRGNIMAMKMLGVEWIICVSAVGSMKEEIAPGHMVIPDQFFDRTKGRNNTFFSDGIVGHITFADPVCPELSDLLAESCRKTGNTVHVGGTYICIEGPQFSTRAESNIYRQWGVDIIGMTNIPEAKLAREAEICYATLAMATDYDCWHESEEDVTVEQIIRILLENVKQAQAIIRETVRMIPDERPCGCPQALKDAVITDRSVVTEEARQRLAPILEKYWGRT